MGRSSLGSNPCCARCILPGCHIITSQCCWGFLRDWASWEGRGEGGRRKWEGMLFSVAVLSYTSWKSLQNHSWDLGVLLPECPTRLLVVLRTTRVSWASIPYAQLFVWGRDGLKSSRQNWECLWMSGHCASLSPREMEIIIVPFSALVVTELQ